MFRINLENDVNPSFISSTRSLKNCCSEEISNNPSVENIYLDNQNS